MILDSLLAAERIYAFDQAWPVLLWVGVGILAALVIVGLGGLFFHCPVKKYAKYAAFGFFVYLLIFALVLLGLAMARNGEYRFAQTYNVSEYLNYFVFLPIFADVAFALASSVVLFTLVTVQTNKKAVKAVAVSLGTLLALLVIATVVLSVVFATVMVKL